MAYFLRRLSGKSAVEAAAAEAEAAERSFDCKRTPRSFARRNKANQRLIDQQDKVLERLDLLNRL